LADVSCAALPLLLDSAWKGAVLLILAFGRSHHA
jgi:hypothetical protein